MMDLIEWFNNVVWISFLNSFTLEVYRFTLSIIRFPAKMREKNTRMI